MSIILKKRRKISPMNNVAIELACTCERQNCYCDCSVSPDGEASFSATVYWLEYQMDAYGMMHKTHGGTDT